MIQRFKALRLERARIEIVRPGAITDLAQEEVLRMSHPGVSHKDLRRTMDMVAARHGATFPFGHISSITMANPTGFYPDFHPAGKRVEDGVFLMAEFAPGSAITGGSLGAPALWAIPRLSTSGISRSPLSCTTTWSPV